MIFVSANEFSDVTVAESVAVVEPDVAFEFWADIEQAFELSSFKILFTDGEEVIWVDGCESEGVPAMQHPVVIFNIDKAVVLKFLLPEFV